MVCQSQFVLAPRTNRELLSPMLPSVVSGWWLEVGPGGGIDTTEMSRSREAEFVPTPPSCFYPHPTHWA